MLQTILLSVLILINLGFFVFVYLNSKKNNQVLGQAKIHLDSLEQTQKQIEMLQNRFKESLERIINSDAQVIDATSKDILRQYQNLQATLLQNFNVNSERLMQALNNELANRVEKLSTFSVKQAEEVKKLLADEIKKDVAGVDKKMEEYANKRYKEVEEKILQVVEETVKETSGKVINMVDHQDLVMTALEKAKKDNFF